MMRQLVCLYLCTSLYLISILISCSSSFSNDKIENQNKNSDRRYCLINWAPLSTLSENVRKKTICTGEYVIDDQNEQEKIVNEAISQLCCIEHIGSWFKNQTCVSDVNLTPGQNDSNPPQQFIDMKVKIKNKQTKGVGSLTFLNYRPTTDVCKPECTSLQMKDCKGRFEVWRFYTTPQN